MPARAASSATSALEVNRAAVAPPLVSASSEAPRRDGEIIVRFRQGTPDARKGELFAAKGLRRKAGLKGESGAERVELARDQDPAAAAVELSRDPAVELAEPNYLVARDQAASDDPRFAEQWALKNTGQDGGTPGSDVHAPAAWQKTTGAASTVIAVLDSGIDFSHPELKNNRWVNNGETEGNGLDDEHDGYADDVDGWNWVYGTGNTSDEQGHGTSVAGVIAAEGGNRSGIAGVMWHASLMNLKVLDSTGTGDTASAVEAIDYAVAHGASVINCSWGTEAESVFLKEAIERAGKRGLLVVASAGNAGRDLSAAPYYPASYELPNLISVASSDGFDNLAQFSNWGATRVALAAPGANILTTQAGGDYHYVSGTSASAPFVTGIAGLVRTSDPRAPLAAVRSALLNGSRHVDALAGKVSSGGVADAAGALAALHGNPQAGNGNGGGNGNGSGDGSGNGAGQGQVNEQGNGQQYVPPSLRGDNEAGRAKGKQGMTDTPPATVKGAPGDNLPNLSESRRVRSSNLKEASAPIHADLMCADCDPSGGGGAGADYPNDPYLGTARTRPTNATGTPDVNLGSRNFNWSLPILSLPGRAGLDLSVALYYNSLVWTKQGSVIEYNADHGSPSPGFQVGLPKLQAQYYDYDANAYAYIMITSSGGRIEMRQTATSGVYESADSTYTQLTFSGSTPVIRTTDGTQYVFGVAVGGEWRCTQIKDRNGNYISAAYDASNGHLTTITDTLGRQVFFHYNADGTLNDIAQSWGGVTHYYAWFVYGTKTIAPNFPGLSVYGVPSGGNQTVLSYVALADNESFHFDYNAYGQVYEIRHKAPDGHELSHTRYNMSDADLGAQSDCPRFTARYEYAQDWNNNQEALTSYSVSNGVTFTHPWNGAQMTGTLVQQTAPDGTVYKEYSQESGWGAGLSQLSEVWSGGVKKKWSANVWTQDDNSLAYSKNPRLVETNIYDAEGNRKRVTIDYNQGYGLPTHVREYGGADGLTLLRLNVTDYNLDAAYVGRRIIGLPYQKLIYDGPSGALQSKVQFYYDWDGGGDMFADTPAAATQHDRTNYGPSFLVGRGNISDVIRYDVNDPNNAGGTTQETKYRVNSTGSVLMERDHLWHAKYFDYADSFSDGNNARNTFAYMTKVTDEDGYVSTSQYNYDFGAVTLKHSPTSGTGTGVTYADAVMQYDSRARITQSTNLANNAYKRWVYDSSYNQVHTYETLTGTTQADEFHSWQVLDGAGRVRASATDHPGSAGGFSGQYVVYDNVGRIAQRSNPTEITGGWVPAGADTAWVNTSQSYDWKGRPLQTTNPDGSTRVLSYGGCGCAGGEVATSQDEHGRLKRYTKDVLGRLQNVEELNWNGTVYATTTYSYNARDQITQINQEGRLRTLDYDGHGRLWHRTTPEQGTTTYAYNGDDTVASVTDARGAKTVYGYSYRHLTTSVSYDLSGVLSGQNVAATPNVSYTYDAAGHRTQMTDGMGTATYHYNSLAQMDWEQRSFSGVGTYQFNYGYNAAGELLSITYPSQFGAVSVSYGYDKAGRLNNVNGAGYAGVTSYASGISYRAFGAVNGMNFSDGHSLSTAYDGRLRTTTWNVAGVIGYNYNYDYYNEKTGRVSYAQSLVNSSLDRSYEYDHVGRLVVSHSGAEARASAYSGQWGVMDGPYSQGYKYDKWGNMTHRYGWGGEVQGGGAGQSSDKYYSYSASNRRTDSGFAYDNAGDLTFDGGQHFTYNAAGRQTYVDWTNLQQGYDGDGMRVSKTDSTTSTVYYLRSSVLGGQVIAEVKNNGAGWGWNRGYVYAGSKLLAVQQGGVFFVYEDPVTKSKRVTNTGGVLQSAVELDPFGADTSASASAAFQPRKFTSYERDANGTDEAMMRRYNRWHSRFDQPDAFDGSYDLTNPQSFNRYAYTHNDPVNFSDPTGLKECVDDAQGRCTVVASMDDPFWDMFSAEYSLADRLFWGFYPIAGPFGGGGPTIDPQNPHPPIPTPVPEPVTKPEERLSDCVKNILANYFPREVLDKIKVHTDGLPTLVQLSEYVSGSKGAVTYMNDVYFKEGAYDPYSAAGIAAIGHEAKHVEQFSQLGEAKFVAKYADSYKDNVLGGMSGTEAYKNNRLEVEPYALQERIKSDLNAIHKGENPCKP